MHTKDITVNALNQELIPYYHPEWLHSIVHTKISETTLNYVPLHWHPDLQFILVKSGLIEIVLGGGTQKLIEGEGMFINSGVVHEIHPKSKDAAFICWNINMETFSQYLYEKYISPIIKEVSISFIILKQEIHGHKVMIEAIYKAFIAYDKEDYGFELTVMSCCFTCLNQILKEFNNLSHNSQVIYDPRIKTLLRFIHENYSQSISLDDLSKIIFLSPSETIRLFKQHVGKTPFNYILNHRLEHSIIFLMSTDSTISEIAYQCGFSSVSYYIKKFKEVYGITPKKYRKTH